MTQPRAVMRRSSGSGFKGALIADWVEATALEVIFGRGSLTLVRLQFREGYPYELLRAATWIHRDSDEDED